MDEEWRDVPGYDGYEASNLGKVRTWVNYKGPRIPGKRTLEPFTLKISRYRNGYARVSVRGKWQLLHKMIAYAFIGIRPPGHEIDHIDTIRDNCKADNLRYLPALDNTRRGSMKNRQLTPLETEYVRSSPKTGKALAAELGVSRYVTQRIRNGSSYKENYG